ncbi:LytR/AlgR family response regulator transcription factor [Aureivirga sp. CE67]|uniref:LytR/AlgR family response regulator transcription factor n=1 Tax=Aureivirga sp. CE67 TaxID=1788983 RepID=UPI0018CB35FA|nr:LytTR family DNA-binding domain-containing protein [Aureivirga sp. CE67]
MKKLNCIIVDDEPIAREIIQTYLSKFPDIELIASCNSAMEAFPILQEKEIDLLFLDIQMPEVTGLSFAKLLKGNVKIIFTTAYREYALDGFDLQAVDYLLKPISFERFMQAIQKVQKTFSEKKSNSEKERKQNVLDNSIFVRVDRKMQKVALDSILYVESLSDYIKIHCENQVLVTRDTMKNVESKLPKHLFLKVHRSFIISISKIDSYTKEYLEINQKAIPISRNMRNEVLSILEY